MLQLGSKKWRKSRISEDLQAAATRCPVSWWSERMGFASHAKCEQAVNPFDGKEYFHPVWGKRRDVWDV